MVQTQQIIRNLKGFGFEESKKVRCLANRMLVREKIKKQQERKIQYSLN